nr:ATP-binding protein [Sporomusa ovata]
MFTSNKTFSQWNEIFAEVTIASAILDRVLHHSTSKATATALKSARSI